MVQAEGPPNEVGDTPDNLLNSEVKALYDALPSEVKEGLVDQFLPRLETLGNDRQSKGEFLALVVRAEKEAYDNFIASSGDGVTASSGGGRCYLSGPTLYSNQLVVQSYSSVSCTLTMRALTSGSQLNRHGYGVVRSNNRVAYARHASSVASTSYAPGGYNYCGHYTAEPVPPNPYPTPPTKSVCKTGRVS